jgi:sugar/nucleoside kinase (ribokinase family)
MSLVVVGSVAFDTIHTPRGSAVETLGGSAVHFALAASLLGPVRMVGNIGGDLTSGHIACLNGRGVCLKGLRLRDGRTFRWTGRYHEDMDTRDTLAVELNVFGAYPPELPPEYADSKFVFLANGSPVHQMQVLDQVRAPEFVALDTMDHWIRSHRTELEGALRRVNGVLVNDSEAKLLTGRERIEAAREMLTMGPQYVIVKGGAHGACMVCAGEVFVIPAYPTTTVVDPTGAGDSFAGGMMGYLARAGRVTPGAVRRAMAYGTIIASYNVEDFGTRRVAALTPDEVEQRLAEFRKIVEF